MKKLFSLLTLALLTMSAWAEADVTLDFTSNTWGFPVGSSEGLTEPAEYSNGTYTITVAATTKYYYNTDGYLLIGKTNSTLTLPAFSQAVSKIVVTGRSGASSSTGQNIFVDGEAVSTATTGATGVNTYEIAEDYQAAGNIYTLMVTTNHNTQITKIEIYYAGNEPEQPTIETVATIAEGNELEDGTQFTFTGNAVVCFKYNKNLWIRDASGSVQVYGDANFGEEFVKGVVIAPNWGATKATYNGIHEYTSPSNFNASNQTQTVEPFPRETLTAENANEYVVLENVTIESTSVSGGKNNFVTNTGITARDNYGINFVPEDGVAYNIIGIVTLFNGVPQVYITEVEGYVAPQPEVVDVNNIAEALALDEGTQFTMYNDVVVTYHNGSRLFIRDTEGNSSMIYGNVGTTFENGQVLSDGWTATYTVYNGLPEFTNPEDVAADGETTRDAAPYERTSTEITDANVNEYVIMKGLTIVPDEENAKNFYVGDLLLFDQFNVNPNIEEGETYDVVGAVTIYNNNVQVYIISVTKVGGTVVEPEAGDYVKVTSTEDLTSGEYLIVYEGGNLAFDGGLETLDASGNSIEVEIVESQLIKGGEAVDAAIFTYDAEAGTLMSASGYYIGRTASSNGMNTSTETVYTNTLSINENGDADIVAEAGHYLRYNASSGQERFRYFKADSYTNQKAIQLYKKVAAAGLRGDVNLDEAVNIADVTSLIDYLLSGDATGISIENANCNQDEGVNIADVTSLIDYLLSGNWPANE